MTMGRPEEFYESGHKHLRNKIFTLEQFIETFTNDDGDVSYYKSWSGFNIPGNKLQEFFTYFSLTKREDALRKLINRTVKKGDYYVIATKAADDLTIAHELIHAHYYLNLEYRRAAQKLVKELDKKIYTVIEKKLLEMGYAQAVIVDEINAYMSTSPASYMKKRFGLVLDKSKYDPFRKLAKTVLPAK